MKQLHTITCPACNGSGKVRLSESLERTLAAVPTGRFTATTEIAKVVMAQEDYLRQASAINNRLAELERNGYVESVKRGKPMFWRRIK